MDEDDGNNNNNNNNNNNDSGCSGGGYSHESNNFLPVLALMDVRQLGSVRPRSPPSFELSPGDVIDDEREFQEFVKSTDPSRKIVLPSQPQPPKIVSFMVDVIFDQLPNGQPNMLDVVVKPAADVTNRASTSSGYLGDYSSSLGSDPPRLFQFPLAHQKGLRFSASSSSSAASAAKNYTQRPPLKSNTINDLLSKWKNSKLVFNLLYEVDKASGTSRYARKTASGNNNNDDHDDDDDDDDDDVNKPDDAKKPRKKYGKRLKRTHTATSEDSGTIKRERKIYCGDQPKDCQALKMAWNDGFDGFNDAGESVSVLLNENFEVDLQIVQNGIEKEASPGPSSSINGMVPFKKRRQLPVLTYIEGLDEETFFYFPSNVKLKLKSISSTGKGKNDANMSRELEILGTAEKGNWFKGLSFILTCSEKTWPESTADSSTDNENFQFTAVPFVYEHLEEQIIMAGGKVYSSVSDIPDFKIDKVLLIAPHPCITPKYVEAMATGIKIVCHEWIVSCCKKRKRVPFQELPVGWSYEYHRFINQFERGLLPLEEVTIHIADGGDRNFYNFWNKVCGIAGAKVLKYTRVKYSEDIILLKEGVHLDQPLVYYTNSVVSIHWVLQSLVHGEMREAMALTKYVPNYDCLSN